MSGSRCAVAAIGLVLVCAAPIERASSATAGDEPEPPSTVVAALSTAASATTSDLSARAADLPGRAQLSGLRLGESARAGIARALPESLLAPMRSARDTTAAWYGTTRSVVRTTASLQGWVAGAGGLRAAGDRVLDVAAALALGAVLLAGALRIAKSSRTPAPGDDASQ